MQLQVTNGGDIEEEGNRSSLLDDNLERVDVHTRKKKKKLSALEGDQSQDGEELEVKPAPSKKKNVSALEGDQSQDSEEQEEVKNAPSKKKKKKRKVSTLAGDQLHDSEELEVKPAPSEKKSKVSALQVGEELEEGKHAPSKKKKNKKRMSSPHEEMQSQEIDSVVREEVDLSSRDRQQIRKSELQVDEDPEDVKCAPSEKKKKKKGISPNEEMQSQEFHDATCVGEEGYNSREGYEPSYPPSSTIENHQQKHKKKKKKKKPEQSLETEEESISAISESAKRSSDDGRLLKKRTRKAGENLTKSVDHESQDLIEDDVDGDPGRIRCELISGNEDHKIPKKKKKKQRLSESQIPEESPSSTDPSKTNQKRKRQLSSPSSSVNSVDEVDTVNTTHKDGVSDGGQRSITPDKSKWKKRKHYVNSEETEEALPSSPNKLLSPSDGQASSDHETHQINTKSSSKRTQIETEETAEGEDDNSDKDSSDKQLNPWDRVGQFFGNDYDSDYDSVEDEQQDDNGPKKPGIHDQFIFTEEQREELRKQGVVVNKGRWTGLEDNILRENLDKFCKKYGVKDQNKLVFPYRYEEQYRIKNFITATKYLFQLAQGIQRAPFDVYLRSRKIFDYLNYKGKFSKKEIAEIRKLRKLKGTKWSRIGQIMQRSGQSVLDYFRTIKDGRRLGKWTYKEKLQLKRAVMAITEPQAGEPAPDRFIGIPWREVHLMIPTRNMHQCKEQWKYVLCWEVGDRMEHRWMHKDYVDLIESLYTSDVKEESDIDWYTLHKDVFWERACSPAKLSFMWHRLKLRYISNHNFMHFENILDEMYTKVLPQMKERAMTQGNGPRIKSRKYIFNSESETDSEHDHNSDDEWM